MNAAPMPDLIAPAPDRRLRITPAVEALVLALAIAIATATYFVITGSSKPAQPLSPPAIASLLVANLVPSIALLMLLGRRIARKRAAASLVGGEGVLHVRLVAIFSIIAAVPALLVTVFASLLFLSRSASNSGPPTGPAACWRTPASWSAKIISVRRTGSSRRCRR